MTSKFKVYEKDKQSSLFEDVKPKMQNTNVPKPSILSPVATPIQTEKMADNNIDAKITDANNAIHTRIKEYVKKNNPKLYILTPCYNGMCYVNI